MSTPTDSWLLTAVWESLAAIHPTGNDRSLADLGRITAVSAQQGGLVILLRVPACDIGFGPGTLVAQIADAIQGVVSVRCIEATAPLSVLAEHEACKLSALTAMRSLGWQPDVSGIPCTNADVRFALQVHLND